MRRNARRHAPLAVLVVSFLLAAAAPLRAGSLESLLQLRSLTVVYPAGAADAETARRSAEARAAWLREVHEIDAAVSADDALTDAELRGNLLLLGWDNAVLRRDDLAPVFRHSADGVSFLGLTAPPDADLQFLHASPLAPGSYWFFWSRIDPELDRFMVLPVSGSDWALYRDFRPLMQGMFADDDAWPPKRNELAQRDHRPFREEQRAAYTTRESAHYTMLYDPAVLSEAAAAKILEAREAALAAAAAALGTTTEGVRIRLEVHADAEVKHGWTGVPDAVHSVPRRQELHMTRRYATNPSPHEEVHLLARRLFGPSFLSSIFEGLAVSREGDYKRIPLDLQAAVLVEKRQLPALEELLDEEALRAMPADVRFPASALLVRWIEATAGVEGLRRAYGVREGSVAALARALGRPAEELQPAFESWVGGVARSQQTEVEYLKAMAAAREAHLLVDYAGVAQAARRALELKPDDPQALQTLATALLRAGDYAGAARGFERLLALPLPADSPFPILAHFDLGRLHDIKGRRKKAVEQYRRVLELPDRFDLHLRARELLEFPATAESLE